MANQNVTIHLIPDDKPEQIAWNIYSYHTYDYIFPENRSIKADTTFTLTLHEGTYSFDCMDTRKNGGLAGEIFISDTLQASWSLDAYREYQFVNFSLTTTCAEIMTCSNAVDYGTVGSTPISDYLESCCEHWYKFETDRVYPRIEITTCGSELQTGLELWQSCDADTPLAIGLQLCGYQAKANIVNLPIGTYYVKIYGHLYDYGDYTLNIHEYEPVQCAATDYGPVNSIAVYGTIDLKERHWYKFSTDGSYNAITVSTCGSDFDTKVEVWKDCNDLEPIALSDDDCGLQESIVLENLDAGDYLIALDGSNVFTGRYILRVTSPVNSIAAPAQLTAVGGNREIDLSWQDVPGATSYNIYQYITASEVCEDYGYISDCDGNCYQEFYLSLLGDGFCDDGSAGPNFSCSKFSYDNSDCQSLTASHNFIQSIESFTPEIRDDIRVQIDNLKSQGVQQMRFSIDSEGNPLVTNGTRDSYLLIGTSLVNNYKITGIRPQASQKYVITALSGSVESGYSNVGSATTLPPDPGTECDAAIQAVSGTNQSDGTNQWFKYKPASNGYLIISSQNTAGNATCDTYVYLYESCEAAAEGTYLAMDDNAFGYKGPSRLIQPVTASVEYLIYWSSQWQPGKFSWTLELKQSFQPDRPTNIQMSADASSITFSWNAVANCYGYKVYQYKDGVYTYLTTTLNPTYSISGLTYNYTMCIAVKAIGLGMDSEYSTIECGTTDPAPKTPHFELAYEGQAYQPMNIYVTSASANAKALSKFDEIAVFDGDVCVGRSQLLDDISTFLLISASADNPKSEATDGFVADHAITYRFWLDSLQIEVDNIAVEYESGITEVFQSSASVNVSLTGTIDNLPPVADAGTDQIIRGSQTVTLDGSASHDPEGESLTFLWKAPESIQLSDATSATPQFAAPLLDETTDLIFTLTVQDTAGLKSTDEVKITVLAASFCTVPSWKILPQNFEFSMNIVAKLIVGKEQSTDINDILAAFNAGSLAGVASVEYIESLNDYLVFLTICSKKSSGDEIYFRVWDDSRCEVLGNIDQTYKFVANSSLGSISEPIELTVQTDIVQTVTIPRGWRWFSLNVEYDDMSLNHIMNTLNIKYTSGDLIKGQKAYAQYLDKIGWIGTLDTLHTGSMYLSNTAYSGAVEIIGQPVNPSMQPLEIVKGWNWIGYLPQIEIVTNDALLFYQASTDDIIKSQHGFAQYLENAGWYGSLRSLLPGEGYMLRAQTGGSFIYPGYGSKLPKLTAVQHPQATSVWEVNPHDFQYNMTMTGVLTIDKNSSVSADDVIGAFVGDECRGTIQGQYIESLDKTLFFLLVYSNAASDESIRFKVYSSSSNEVLDVTETIEFSSNAIVGSLVEPYEWSATTSALVDNVSEPVTFNLKQNFPNPFNPNTTIEYSIPRNEFVDLKIFNMIGQEIKRLVQSNQTAGAHVIQWDGKNNAGETMSAGIYIVQITAGTFSDNRRIVLLK